MKIDSVFPISGEWERCPDRATTRYTGSFGLTKRELFAAMAMQGLCASDVVQEYLKNNTNWGSGQGAGVLAISAVGLADALIAELAKAPAESSGMGFFDDQGIKK